MLQIPLLNDVTDIDHKVTSASVLFTFGIYLYFFHKASLGSFNLITASSLDSKLEKKSNKRFVCTAKRGKCLRPFLVWKCSFLPDNDTSGTEIKYLSASGYVIVSQKDLFHRFHSPGCIKSEKESSFIYQDPL